MATSSPKVLFHAVGGDLFRSGDGGSTWAALPPLPTAECPFTVTSAAVDALDSNLLLIVRQVGPCTRTGDYWGEVLQSRDGGVSWVIRLRLLREVPRAVTSPDSFWFLGERLLRSPDGGASFTVALPLEVDVIDFDPKDARHVYAGSPDGLRRSVDAGSTWFPVDLGGAVASVLVNSANSAEIFAKANETWFRSGDFGSSWLPYATDHTDLLASDPSNGSLLYGRDGSELRKTIDHLVTWRPILEGLKATSISALAVNSSLPGHAWATADLTSFFSEDPTLRTDVYETIDAGRSWRRLGAIPARFVVSLTFDPVFGVLYAGGDSSVFHSEDGGRTWSAPFLAGGPGQFSPVVAFAPSNPQVVYATGGSLYRSADSGRTWTALPRLVSATAVAVDPRKPDVVYANAYDDGTGFLGVLKTSDGGMTWIRLQQPPSNGPRILFLDPVEPENVYVGGETGLSRSPDAGLTWKALATVALPVSVQPHPSRSGELFALDGRGKVLRSLDYGGSWRLLPGVPDFGCGASFCFGTSTMSIGADALYVGSPGKGVFVTTSFDFTRTRSVTTVPERR